MQKERLTESQDYVGPRCKKDNFENSCESLGKVWPVHSHPLRQKSSSFGTVQSRETIWLVSFFGLMWLLSQPSLIIVRLLLLQLFVTYRKGHSVTPPPHAHHLPSLLGTRKSTILAFQFVCMRLESKPGNLTGRKRKQ